MKNSKAEPIKMTSGKLGAIKGGKSGGISSLKNGTAPKGQVVKMNSGKAKPSSGSLGTVKAAKSGGIGGKGGGLKV